MNTLARNAYTALLLSFVAATSFSQSRDVLAPTNVFTFSITSFGQGGQARACVPAESGNIVLAGEAITLADTTPGLWPRETDIYNTTAKYSLNGQLLWEHSSDSVGSTYSQEVVCFPESNSVIQNINTFAPWNGSQYVQVNVLESLNLYSGELNWFMNLDSAVGYELAPWQGQILLFRSIHGVNTTCHILGQDGKERSSFFVDQWTGNSKMIARGDKLWVIGNVYTGAYELPKGNLLWKIPNDSPSQIVTPEGAVDNTGNSYLAFGDFRMSSGSGWKGLIYPFRVIKYDSSGKEMWNTSWYPYPDSTSNIENITNSLDGASINSSGDLLAVFGVCLAPWGDSDYEWQLGYVAILSTATGDTLWTDKWSYAADSGITQYEDGFFEGDELVLVGNWSPGYGIDSNFVRIFQFNVTGMKNLPPVRKAYKLCQNYPNPFNPSTVISYQLPANSFVTLKIYDVLGRQVETLVNGRESAGTHLVVFNASNLVSGVYFYRLQTQAYSETKKLMVLK